MKTKRLFNMDCRTCKSKNYYLGQDALQCRECGSYTDIDPATWDQFPNVSEVRRKVWDLVNQDLARLDQLKEDFNFCYAETPKDIYIKFFNICQFLTYGRVWDKPTPVYPPAGRIFFNIREKGSPDGIYRLIFTPDQPTIPRGGNPATYQGQAQKVDQDYQVKPGDPGRAFHITGRQYKFYPEAWRGYWLEVHEDQLIIKEDAKKKVLPGKPEVPARNAAQSGGSPGKPARRKK